MTEKLAEAIITSILNYGQQGIKDEAELTDKLESDFAGLEIDFGSFFEMMNTGVFRANFTMSYGQYPVGNLTEHAVVKLHSECTGFPKEVKKITLKDLLLRKGNGGNSGNLI